jgi:hypothetical protein
MIQILIGLVMVLLGTIVIILCVSKPDPRALGEGSGFRVDLSGYRSNCYCHYSKDRILENKKSENSFEKKTSKLKVS